MQHRLLVFPIPNCVFLRRPLALQARGQETPLEWQATRAQSKDHIQMAGASHSETPGISQLLRPTALLVHFEEVARTVTARKRWEVMTWLLAATCASALDSRSSATPRWSLSPQHHSKPQPRGQGSSCYSVQLLGSITKLVKNLYLGLWNP